MPQDHLDRLAPMDAMLVYMDGPTSPMNIAGPLIVEGPPPAMQDLFAHLAQRLDLMPRLRQKLRMAPLNSGRPVWVDDADFDLASHLRHEVLPAPGDMSGLEALCGEIIGQRMDLSKPLWEIWLVDGLQGNRFAVIPKMHHCMLDGISVLHHCYPTLFDLVAAPADVPSPGGRWQPGAAPSTARLIGRSSQATMRAGMELLAGYCGALSRPRRALHSARQSGGEVRAVAKALLESAPATPLNFQNGPRRRVVVVPGQLSDAQIVKQMFGGTVNDVVLAVTTGALRRFLDMRDVRTDITLRGLVAVSMRTADEHANWGNRVTQMRVPLPVYMDDPLARLRYVATATRALKGSKETRGFNLILDLQRFAPPSILAKAFSTRSFNVAISNMPGPPAPLYALGRKVERIFPIVPLPRGHGLTVGVVSYGGELTFGLTGDFDGLPDLDKLGVAIAAELRSLVNLARASARGTETDASLSS